MLTELDISRRQSAIVPTLIANGFFLPRHLLPPPAPRAAAEPVRET